MNRVCRVLTPAAVAIAALALVSGCSSGKKNPAVPATTTTTSTVPGSSSSAAPTTTSSSAPATTTTGGAPAPTVTTAAGGPSPSITGFTVAPPSPVECNAPTSIQLTWTATGTSSVALSIDGKLFAAFGGGTQDHLEPLACDGKTHTYLLTALGHGQNATAVKLVTSNPVS